MSAGLGRGRARFVGFGGFAGFGFVGFGGFGRPLGGGVGGTLTLTKTRQFSIGKRSLFSPKSVLSLRKTLFCTSKECCSLGKLEPMPKNVVSLRKLEVFLESRHFLRNTDELL